MRDGALEGLLKRTFRISLTAQVIALVLSVIALTRDGGSELLRATLIIGLVVAGIQFAYYTQAYARAFWLGQEGVLAIRNRYADWTLTTPLMMIGLHSLIVYFDDNCAGLDDTFGDAAVVTANVVAVLADLGMLACGYLVDSERFTDPSRALGTLGVGFGFLVFTYLPSFVLVGMFYTVESLLIVIASLLLWCAYGLASIKYMYEPERRNVAYNVFDVFAKNIYQIVRCRRRTHTLTRSHVHTRTYPHAPYLAQAIAIHVLSTSKTC